MQNPSHYKIGINNEKFSHRVFWTWIATGWVQAIVVFALCMYVPNTSSFDDCSFKDWNLMAGGQNVFAACVVIVNMVILKMSHLWHWWAVVLIVLQIIAVYIYTYLQNEILNGSSFVIWKFFMEYMNNPSAWFGLVLVVAFCMLGMTAVQSFIGLGKIVTNSTKAKVRNLRS